MSRVACHLSLNMCAANELVIIFILVFKTYAEENLYYNNGWRPTIKHPIIDDVYRDLVTLPDHLTVSWNPVVRSPQGTAKFELSVPYLVNRGLIDEDGYDYIEIDKKRQELKDEKNQQGRRQDIRSKHANPENKNMEKPIGNIRNAKKIVGARLDNNVIGYKIDENVKSESAEWTLEESGEKETITLNTYEVTEATEELEIMNLLKHHQNKTVHSTPNINTARDRSLTSKLFDILGKYNINVDDDLANYAQSRKKDGAPAPKQGYAYIVPVRCTGHYHRPPLSPRGRRPPGPHGFPGKFHNIDGYVPGNNINSNGPFGSYKIYSDTDSSN